MDTMESTVTVEKQLQESGTAMIERAKTMVITSHDDYEEAGKALVEIKTRMKQVTDYWKEPKAQAASAHKTICNKEKEMLSPLNEAEKIIKNAMVLYQSAVEKARREAEEEARRQKQAETDRLLVKAMKAEANGDDQTADINMAMAQMIEDMPATPAVMSPSASGTYIRKTWKARVTNPMLVPAYSGGIELREIKMSALNQIAKMTNGTVKIDGVEFYEESTIGART